MELSHIEKAIRGIPIITIRKYIIAKLSVSLWAQRRESSSPANIYTPRVIGRDVANMNPDIYIAYFWASAFFFAQRFLLTSAHMAIERPILIDVVKNRSVPAYQTAAAKLFCHSSEIK